MLSETKEGLFVEIAVRPNSPEFKVEKKDKLIVHCRSKPEGNKANEEIVRGLERLFKAKVKIIKGLKSKRKCILIRGMTAERFREMVS
ncbi:hypothetical protein A3K63_02660 [Candidatus Micrarchaeota archaeon RBG_16_49_10]|nr:MAG: hypothetical protein A3K63_02660 [Candidatus Micrarchaeota archaeon RBG_16_49_10]